MARNIEIKARAANLAAIKAIAQSLSAQEAQIIEQRDVFFQTPEGRLKLRFLALDHGELIFYVRPDQAGPKTSNYWISKTREPESLRLVLMAAYGETIVVEKTRTLIMLGRTRVHLDQVRGLGDFVELEVVLDTHENAEDGIGEAHDIMRRLGISDADLIEGAYADLLAANRAAL